MRLLSFVLMLGLALVPNIVASDEAKREIRFVIAGVKENDLAALFATLDGHYNQELGSELPALGWSGPFSLLNLARDPDTGEVQNVTFSRGKFFISFSPKDETAQSSVYLNPGFEYEVNLEVSDGTASIVQAGTVSIGAEPFETN